MNYKHFTIDERACIARYLNEKMPVTKIAELLDRHYSSVYREIKRNSDEKGNYSPALANVKARCRQEDKKNNMKYDDEKKEKIEKRLTMHWSPEQITGFYRSEDKSFISFKTIYRWLRDGKLFDGDLSVLRRKGKAYKRRCDVNRMSGGKSIHDRPAEAEERSEVGHWELDTVVSGKGSTACLVTIVDRKSRYLKSKLVPNRTASVVTSAICSLLKNEPVKTLTADNGKEFSEYKKLEKALNTEVYFADPYASWQRGTNENTNGLIREFMPKGCDLGEYTESRLSFKGKNVLFSFLLASMMFPSVVNLIPLYKIVDILGWVNTPLAMIVPGAAGVFNIFLVKQFMDNIPKDFDEAAQIDGAGEWLIFRKIIFPLIKPVLLVVFLFAFTGSWNDFLWPSIVFNDIEKMPITSGLQLLQGMYQAQPTLLMAGALVAIIPTFVLYLFAQKYFLQSMSLSAGVKG